MAVVNEELTESQRPKRFGGPETIQSAVPRGGGNPCLPQGRASQLGGKRSTCYGNPSSSANPFIRDAVPGGKDARPLRQPRMVAATAPHFEALPALSSVALLQLFSGG